MFNRLPPLHIVLVACTLALIGTTTSLAVMPARQTDQTLKVATKPLEPFVIRQGDTFVGFSIDLWDAIARQLNLRYEWVDVGTVNNQIAAVRSGSADVALAGISMTAEREQRVDFSHPYFTAGLQILTTTTADGGLSSLWAFLRMSLPALLSYLGIGLLIALGLAHLVWLLERRSNPDFQHGYGAGIWEGLWWLLGIVANGEYGDKQTRSIGKRLLTITLWLVGVILIAQFTASVTSALTVQRLSSAISGPGDLPGKTVATVTGSTSAQYLAAQHVKFVGVRTIEAAYQLLVDHQVQAVVYDAPVLQYYSMTQGKGVVQVVGPIFKEETYGIALPNGSLLRKRINETLLQMRQDGTYDAIYARWFGARP
ncbi:MAG: transporter substrate-binding domain-containing protein [Oscillochloris sp.]|nr:transporter substrate-binding domain-containing protein [Oscillochloris sp.]